MDNKGKNSIDAGVGRFEAEASVVIDDEIPLFDLSAYPRSSVRFWLRVTAELKRPTINIV